MIDNYIIKYWSKGLQEFVFNFKINDFAEIIVWLNDDLQYMSDYRIQIEAITGKNKVIFKNKIGTESNPILVTIAKQPFVTRQSTFLNFTSFRAEILNEELDNCIELIKAKSNILNNAVLKSNLELNNTEIRLPKSLEGRGLYWGKNGKLLNTDFNLNDIINNIITDGQITINSLEANIIKLDTQKTNIKQVNVQKFLEELDSSLQRLNAGIEDIAIKALDSINKIGDLLIIKEQQLEVIKQVNKLKNNQINNRDSIAQLNKQIIESFPNKQMQKTQTIVKAPQNSKGEYCYIDAENIKRGFVLDIININKDNPLIINFANNDKHVNEFTINVLKDFQKSLYLTERIAGRYYLYIQLIDNNFMFSGSLDKPFYSFDIPKPQQLQAYGLLKNNSYFVINNNSLYEYDHLLAEFKIIKKVYIGYIDIDENGFLLSGRKLQYFSFKAELDYYLDIFTTNSYVLDNYFGCNILIIRLELVYYGEVIPLDNNCKYVNHDIEVLIGYTYSLDFIKIAINLIAKNIDQNKIMLRVNVKRGF
ncbi:hypothetical protein ACFX5K_02770 [Rickettsiales bacterium LUAb2]